MIGQTADRDLLDILHGELLLTVGCTDPAAIGFAASAAISPSEEQRIESVEIILDPNILKNASSVIIPGTGKSGIALAAALGIVIKNYERGVLLFENMNIDNIKAAETLLEGIPFKVSRKKNAGHIFVNIIINYESGYKTESLLEYSHDNLVYIKENNDLIWGENKKSEIKSALLKKKPVPVLSDLIKQIESISGEDLTFLSDPAVKNQFVAEAGLASSPGSGIGSWLKNLYDSADEDNWPSIILKSRYKVAAATDARMGGIDIPVVACGGSGNHGLTFFITLDEVLSVKKNDSGPDYAHCAALGLAILHHIKESTGILTPMCGCAMAAGMAASASLTWYLGGDERAILRSMNYVLGFLGGLVCEGAKKECSLKTSLSSQIAIESALLSLNDKKIDGRSGLFSSTFKGILDNLELIHKKGMIGFDEVMIDILLKKDSEEDI